jgi:hypothetical protein
VCADCATTGDLERVSCNLPALCPSCAKARAKRRRQDLRRAMQLLPVQDCGDWRMVTLTVRTEGDYRAAAETIAAQVGRIWRDLLRWTWRRAPAAPKVRRVSDGRCYWGPRRIFPDGAGGWWVRQDRVRGAGFRSIEFGPLHGNAHVHMLLHCPWIPGGKTAAGDHYSVLKEEWRRLTGSYVVDVRLVRKHAGRDQVSIAGALVECTKYLTKVGEVAPELLVSIWRSLAGHQVTQLYGDFRGLACEEADLDFRCACGCRRYHWEYVPLTMQDPTKKERGP